MDLVNWRAELQAIEERFMRLRESQRMILKLPILDLVEHEVTTVRSSTSFSDALKLFSDKEIDFILVQDFPDTVKGVLKRETLIAAQPIEKASARPLSVLSFIDRQICIEPESANVEEVLSRMTKGFSQCMLVVDAFGRPLSLVSPRSLVLSLSERLVGVGIGAAMASSRGAIF